jgi:hypothetical protein
LDINKERQKKKGYTLLKQYLPGQDVTKDPQCLQNKFAGRSGQDI